MTSLEHELHLRYLGPEVDSGKMSSYAAAAAIIGFSDFLGVIAKAKYGDSAKIHSEIKAFEHGSFVIDFGLQVGGILTTLFSSGSDPKDLYELVKQTFDLWKHLKGEPPKSISRVDEQSIKVENNFGTIQIFRAETMSIVSNDTAGKAAQQFIGNTLNEGVTAVEISGDRLPLITATKDEAEFYCQIDTDSVISENISEVWLVLESPVFKDGNKWKFNDGRSPFFAAITDEAYLNKVRTGEERFGFGDQLRVKLKTFQIRSGNTYKLEYEVTEVIEHKLPMHQHQFLN